MKKYEEAKIEIIRLTEEDIIITSGTETEQTGLPGLNEGF